jgi:hypothetical protein
MWRIVLPPSRNATLRMIGITAFALRFFHFAARQFMPIPAPFHEHSRIPS